MDLAEKLKGWSERLLDWTQDFQLLRRAQVEIRKIAKEIDEEHTWEKIRQNKGKADG